MHRGGVVRRLGEWHVGDDHAPPHTMTRAAVLFAHEFHRALLIRPTLAAVHLRTQHEHVATGRFALRCFAMRAVFLTPALGNAAARQQQPAQQRYGKPICTTLHG